MSDWNLFGGRPGLGIFGELGVQLTFTGKDAIDLACGGFYA